MARNFIYYFVLYTTTLSLVFCTGSTFASNQSDKNFDNPDSPTRPSLRAARTELDQSTVSVPIAPTDLSVQTSSTTAVLSWTAPDGDVTGYFIYYGNVSDDKLVKVDEVPSPSTNYKVDGLVSNSAYKFAVSSLSGSDDESGQSDVIKANTTFKKPISITVNIKSLSDVEIQWNPIDVGGDVMKVESYIIFWSSIFGKESISVNADKYCSAYICTFYITGWQPNTKYEMKVAAESSTLVLGDISDAVYSTTVFGTPSDVTIANRTSSTMNITWNPPDVGGGAKSVQYYQTVLDPADENGQTIFQTYDNTTHMEVSNLSPNSFYTFNVSTLANNGGTTVVGDKSDEVTVWTFPGRPDNVNIDYGEVNTTEVKISFDEPHNGASQYEARFKLPGQVEIIFSSPNSPIEVFNLKPGETYDVCVRANNSAGYGLDSGLQQITMVPLSVVDLKVKNVTDNFIFISWNVSHKEFIYDMQVVQYTVRNESKYDYMSNTTHSDKIFNLTSGAEYLIEVLTVSNNVKSEPRAVIEVTDLLGVMGLKAESQTTTSIEIAWEAPPARLNFDNYSITYDPSGKDFTAIIVPAPATSINVTELDPGTLYKISITRIGIVESDTLVEYLATKLKISQNKDSPSTGLDLEWMRPSGSGDEIQIQYFNSQSSINKTVSFDDTSATISVAPGYTYTADIAVISNTLQSEVLTVQMNSKPDQPQYVVFPGVYNLTLSWEFPDGSYEGFIVTCEGQRFYVDKTEKSQTCSGLNPNSQYTVDVNSWITDINGDEETSLVKETSHTTGSASPAPANSLVELSTNGKQTPNAITFLLTEGTFTDKNGPIEYYAVYILADNTDKTTSAPDLTGRDSCQNLGGETKECVSLWYDVRELNTNSRWKRSFDDPVPNPPISFIIGNGSKSISPWNESYINYKLQPNTDYQVSVAAKTSNDEMTATNWSVVISTNSLSTSVAAIVGIIVIVIVVICLVIIGVCICMKRRRKSLDSTSEEETPYVDVQFPMEPRTILLSEFVRNFEKMTPRELMEEYLTLTKVGDEKSRKIADKSCNKNKNRFSDKLPYDETRVQLHPLLGVTGSNYINASHIYGFSRNREYIASPTPLSQTINDFWRMIWEQEVTLIVMLGPPVDKGKIVCEQYWPENNVPMNMDFLTLQLTTEKVQNSFARRQFKLEKSGKERIIAQFHYPFSFSDDLDETEIPVLMDFIALVRLEVKRKSGNGPLVVHCRNGCGETGTFIALDQISQHIQNKSLSSVLEIVRRLRQDRTCMVENLKQYLLLYKSVKHVSDNPYDIVINNNRDENEGQAVYQNEPI